MGSRQDLTREEILALGDTDPEYAAWKASNVVPKTNWEDPAALRTSREDRNRKLLEDLGNPGVTIQIPMRDGYLSSIRVYKPQNPPARSPLVVLMFGGAFLVGDNRQLAPYAVALNALYGATVALLSYRLAPEHTFPTAQHDVWDSLLWITEKGASELGADLSSGFVLGGVSAGGSLAAAIGQHWVDAQKTPRISGLWLCIPHLFSDIGHVPAEYQKDYLAREQNRNSDIIDSDTFHWVETYQKPDKTSPFYSPFNSSNPEKHSNLAENGIRVYFQAAGQDPLRDDALIYEHVLRKNGVETKLDIYPGVPHGHFVYFPFLKEAKRANVDNIQAFAWLLRQNIPSSDDIARVLATPGDA